jgi:outer membrane protein assembly factor BamE (lipoprotein component of BamABCDE complex)
MRVFLTWVAVFIASCASDGSSLRPGVSSAEDVRQAMGTPALEMTNPDGSRQMAYPKGYFSEQTFMVHVGSDGKFQSIDQVLKDDTFYRIQPGQTRDDILRLLGPPLETMEFSRLQQVAWDYRYQDAWGYTAILSVMFNREGIVVGRTSRRLDRGNDRAR